MPDPRGHGWWPYLVPYAAFLLLIQATSGFEGTAGLVALGLRVAVPAALVFWFWREGRYPELGGYRIGAGTLADGAAGIVIAVLWILPFALFPGLERGDAFQPGEPGTASRTLTLTLRLIGFALVTPFVEELFVRSFLHRFLDVWDGRGHFLDRPMATYTPVAFFGTIVWFIFSHAPWEWGVSAVACALFNLWLYRRAHLGAVVVAHAAANAAIWGWVVLGPGGYWEFL